MNDEAKDRIVEQMNLGTLKSRGYHAALKDSLGYDPSPKQKKLISNRIVEEEYNRGERFEKNGKTYIKLGKKDYRSVKHVGANIYYNSSNDTYYRKNPNTGKFESIAEDLQ